MKILPTDFDGQSIRRVYDEDTETWWFSVIDVVQVLTQQVDDLTARKYWNQLKRRLANEGSQLVTSCHQLKMPAADGKQRLTDVATAETLLRLVQEALTNAARHADANRLSVHLRREGAEVILHMEDDGRIKGAIREGNGIAGMRERIAALRGRFDLGTTPRGGLRIDARLPA